eukprot:1513283-Amphidinium_carterae.1
MPRAGAVECKSCGAAPAVWLVARPLGKCCCCEHLACEAHLESPVCLDRVVPMCACHPHFDIEPGVDFSWLRNFWH